MLRLILMFLAFPIAVAAQDLDRRSIAGFWDYIEENEELLSTEPNIVLMFNEIRYQLDKVHSDLVFEFSNLAIQPRRLVISADGTISNFPLVEDLVSAAPDFENLEIIAFRQPVDDFTEIDFEQGQALLKPSELSFIHLDDRGQFDLVLIHEDFGGSTRDQAVGIAFLILDAAVGEYRVATQVGAIDFVPPSDVPDTYEPLPIALFPEALDLFIQASKP